MKNKYNPLKLCEACQEKEPAILRRGIDIGVERVQSKKISELKLEITQLKSELEEVKARNEHLEKCNLSFAMQEQRLIEANRRLEMWVESTLRLVKSHFDKNADERCLDKNAGPVLPDWTPDTKPTQGGEDE